MVQTKAFVATATALVLSAAVPPASKAPAKSTKVETGTAKVATVFPPGRDPRASTSLFWGDLHLHTYNSPDAFINGNTAMSPAEAYRFARGEEVVSQSGLRVKLRRPLDFLAVTDHSEYLGVHVGLDRKDVAFADWHVGKRWARLLAAEGRVAYLMDMIRTIDENRPEDALPTRVKTGIWQNYLSIADRFNQPGRFTALIGYEWSASASGDNLHRNVLFRGGGDEAGKTLPFTSQDSNRPEDLWTALARIEQETGSQVLAIPHNANLSNGRMFFPTMSDGSPISAAYARQRIRWEPAVEVTQIKGDGESHPTLSPGDEFADFENWDTTNLMRTAPKKPEMLRYEYARSVLGEGLRHKRMLGVNPFQFGMIGATDAHTGLSGVEEDNFLGKFANGEPSATRMFDRMAGISEFNWRLVSSGLTAVWATENTREAIFDAIKRREVYATTGPRIQVRFFGGYDFANRDILRPDFAAIGYGKGVPMGGELVAPTGGRAPRFMIQATKDPDGANLDRVQVIKMRLKPDGTLEERIFDVAWSGNRTIDTGTGTLERLRSTVDVKNALYENSVGAVQLATVWTDPEFRDDEHAYYYLRVLEIPTPRWTTYEAAYFGVALPERVPVEIQERAYSSPIWYSPPR